MAVLGEVVLSFHDDGMVTCSGFSAGEAAQHSAAVRTVTTAIPGSTVIEDPWDTQAPPRTQTAPVTPSCVHGPLKAVPGGIAGPNARNPGKPYGAFWACQAPQGVSKCRLDRSTLPPVPA